MTHAPASLTALARYWVAQGGVNLGIVGDSAHAGRASYHNGRDRIVRYGRLYTDYSCQNVRDRSGLTDAASAIDLGKLDANYGKLRAFSRWLVKRCQSGAVGTDDIREIIYTPDGKTVYRWDRERGFASAPRAGEGDSSHLWHTHISFYRDSEKRPKVGIFAAYFELPDTSTEDDDVRIVTVTVDRWPDPKPFTSTVKSLRRFTATAELAPIPGPYQATVDANVAISGNPSSPRGVGFLRLASGGSKGRYILASQVEVAA